MKLASFVTNSSYRAGQGELSAMTPAQAHLGVSLLLRGTRRGEYLTGIKPAVLRPSNPPLLRFCAIGGSVEDGEGFQEAAHREAWEEIRCPIQLCSSPVTWVVDIRGKVKAMVLDEEVAPLALVAYYYRTPPRQPWSEQNQGVSFQAVYAATLAGQPEPTDEIPALAWLKPSHISQLTTRDVPLRELLDEGLELVARGETAVYAQGTTRLTAAQEALFCALGEEAPQFWATVGNVG